MKTTQETTKAAGKISTENGNGNGGRTQTTVGIYGAHLRALEIMQQMRRFPRVTDVVRLLIEDAAVANGFGTFERGEFVVREAGSGERGAWSGEQGAGSGKNFVCNGGNGVVPAGAGSAAGVVAQRASDGVRSRRPSRARK